VADGHVLDVVTGGDTAERCRVQPVLFLQNKEQISKGIKRMDYFAK
jgi:hypothetical protein